MFEASPTWLVLLATASLAALISRSRPGARAWLLATSSAVVLVFAAGLSPASLASLAAACAWVLLAVRITAPLAARRPLVASLLAYLPILVLLAVAKGMTARAVAPLQFLHFVGLSFFAVKAWTFIKDVHDQRIKSPDVSTVLAYLLFFPTYASGPMHLYPEFEKTVASPATVDGEAIVEAAYRITLGLVKIKVLAPLLSPISLVALQDAEVIRPGPLVVGAFVYSIVLWADFSGYSDLAVGAGRLLGIVVPENFRAPYWAPNLREFWQRWHITFSRVLTGYVFVPISRSLGKSAWWGPRRRATAAIATLITFLLCGWWHGETLGFIAWGAFHGLGLVVSDLLKPSGRPPVRSPARQRARTAFGIVATFGFVSLGWIFFAIPSGRLLP